MKLEGWKNKNGTDERECKCGSWKQHWINSSGKKWPEKCSISGCSNNAELGAHIINTSISREEYIVPACESCNHLTDEFDLKADTEFVSANKQKTCEQ